MFFQKITGGSVIDTCYCGLQADAPVTPRSISHGIAQPGYSVRYVRETYVLHVVESGTGRVDGHKIGAGDVFLLRPMLAHHIEVTGDAPLAQYWIEFVGTDVKREIDDRLLAKRSEFHGSDTSALGGFLYDSVYNDAAERACAARQLGLIHLILSLLPQESFGTDPHERDYVRRAMDFLRLNLSKGVTVSDAAKAVGLSERYLYRLFLRKTGKKPIEYLAECRIETAKTLLRSTALGVQEIAAAVGIGDPSYFTRFFRQAVGKSPSEFKKGD